MRKNGKGKEKMEINEKVKEETDKFSGKKD